MTQDELCPVCGFALAEPPWRDGRASYEICPSCGVQFGYDDALPDAAQRAEIYRARRARWIESGMRWWSMGASRKPDDWNPEDQLKRIQGSG